VTFSPFRVADTTARSDNRNHRPGAGGKETYRRSQLEWALWKLATLDAENRNEPISAFRARIKHLLQLDRAGTLLNRATGISS
jgi:hypothetical protein